MGFTEAESSEALKTHNTLEEAVEHLFGYDPGGKTSQNGSHIGDVLEFKRSGSISSEASASRDNTNQQVAQKEHEEEDDDEDDEEGEWIVQQSSRTRTQSKSLSRSRSQSPAFNSRQSATP